MATMSIMDVINGVTTGFAKTVLGASKIANGTSVVSPLQYGTDEYKKAVSANIQYKMEPGVSAESLGYFEGSTAITQEFDGITASKVKLAMNDGLSYKNEDWYRFDRWYSAKPFDEGTPNRHYLFFLRPDLYLLDENRNLSEESGAKYNSHMQYMKKYYPQILESLCGEFSGGTHTAAAFATDSGYGNQVAISGGDIFNKEVTIHSFLPFLTGRAESLQLPDYSIKSFLLTQPYTKYALPFTITAIESTTGGTFDVSFREDKDLSITKLFYTWIYYMDGVMRNKFRPKDKYMLYNSLDYASSVYDIIVDPTGENIIWFGKYTGVMPTAVPTSELSWNKGGSPGNSTSISFAYFNFEQMNPEILVDFNYNSLGYIYMNNTVLPANGQINMRAVPPYDSDTGMMGHNYVGRPYITQDGRNGFKLKWGII